MRASDARRCFVVGCLFALLLSAAGCRSSSRETGGPLRDEAGNRTMATAPVRRGQFHVLGLFVPKNKGNRRCDPRERGAEQAEQHPRLGDALRRRPPPESWVHDRLGTRLAPARLPGEDPPGPGVPDPEWSVRRILIGARSLPSFRVAYRVGDRNFKTTYLQGMGLRVVRDLPWAESSASFSAFRTEAGNIGGSSAARSVLARVTR